MSKDKDIMDTIRDELLDVYCKGILFAADSIKTKSADEFRKIVETAESLRKQHDSRIHREGGSLKESGAPTPNTQNCANCKVPRHYRVFGNLGGDVILKEPFDESATDGDFLRKALEPELAAERELEGAKKLRKLVIEDEP